MIDLKRPLCFIDLETTGTDTVKDRIVEISICKVQTNGDREVKTRRINPVIQIPVQASEVHGIYDIDVKDERTFKELSKGLHSFIEGCDIGGYNSNRFDFPLLYQEFYRCGIDWDYTKIHMVDIGNIFIIKEPRTLSAAHQFYCGKPLEEAHSAEADILGTVDVFEKQLERYDDLPKDVEALDLFCNYNNKRIDLSGFFIQGEKEGQMLFAKGKHKGNEVTNHLDYVHWIFMTTNPPFPADTKKICGQILKL